jgi:hypothetical protein
LRVPEVLSALRRKEKQFMLRVQRRRWGISVAILVSTGLVLLAGCSQDLMEPDVSAPTGTTIENPADGSSLNSPVINVRGRAEVGATIEIYVDGAFQSSGVSAPAVPNDGQGGRYQVTGVGLGGEGQKTLTTRVIDLYGNVATAGNSPSVGISLDLTAPDVLVEGVTGATWDEEFEYWETNLPNLRVVGITEATAQLAQIKLEDARFLADTYDSIPGSPELLKFEIPLSPPISGGGFDIISTYSLQVTDPAGNVGAVPLVVHWVIAGQEQELSHDDGHYDHASDTFAANFAGQRIAVRYQAPVWASYVTKVIFYNANDQQNHPTNPELPSTRPWYTYVWRVTLPDSLPGTAANDGQMDFNPDDWGVYPEDAWVTITLDEAIDITDPAHFPDKKFYVGAQWYRRMYPVFYFDAASATNPLDYKTFFHNNYSWDPYSADIMIHAVVSDVPFTDKGREAVLTPVR